MTAEFSPRELRDALGLFATGVTVITAVRPDGEPAGVTANSFTSLSLDPPLVLWCIAKSSGSVDTFSLGASFAVHILSQHQQEIALHFARRGRDKFEVDRQWRSNPAPPNVADALCRFDCRVHALHPGGDHLIVVGEVLGITRREGAPLGFYQGRFGNFLPDSRSPKVDIWNNWHGEWV